MSWTPSPASSIAMRPACRARFNEVVPELRVKGVHPIPTIAVLSLMDCSGTSPPQGLRHSLACRLSGARPLVSTSPVTGRHCTGFWARVKCKMSASAFQYDGTPKGPHRTMEVPMAKQGLRWLDSDMHL